MTRAAAAIGYGSPALVGAYIALLAVFLYGVLRPRRPSEWRSAGWAQAWVIALYAEMYGWPLTAHLVMGWLGHSPADAQRHWNGHLWPVLLGLEGDALRTAQIATTIVGLALIAVGALIALVAWRTLHRAVRADRLADDGLYARMRHPQYAGFFLFLAGSALNWPTLPTLVTLPVLVLVYIRLARDEECDALARWGDAYRDYAQRTGRFWPRLATPA